MVERLVADGFKVVATAHRAVKPRVACRGGRAFRRSDRTSSGQRTCRRGIALGHRSFGGGHSAALLRPAQRLPVRSTSTPPLRWCVRAAALPSPPRFVHASSVAVHGSRNPHRCNDLLTAETPLAASDLYSCHKILAENIVRASDLEWSILRLGGVLTLEPLVDYRDFDSYYFGASLPEDNRVHTVDSRDVAAAFAAAITTDVVREVFMIAGDDSHKRLHGEVGHSGAEAMGMAALMFPGRPGNPDSDGGLVCAGLDGHRPRAAGAVLSAVLQLGDLCRDSRQDGLEAASVACGRRR